MTTLNQVVTKFMTGKTKSKGEEKMEKLIAIVGLTSSGKSGLGIELAKKFNGEIVSADSRQVYTGLDWCSGKVTKEEQAEVKHHLIDICELGSQFTLFDFQQKAYEAIDDILSRGKIPFLVGGTGLYSRSVIEGYDLSPDKPDQDLRDELESKPEEELLSLCKEKGLELPGEITKRRLVRLLETAGKEKKENKPRYEVLQIGIMWSREDIYERIRLRLEMRMPNMIEEIKNLLASGKDKAFLISLGLEAKYVIKYLDGEFETYEEFFEELFKEERHFAKRQQTWYNKEKNIVWLDAKSHLPQEAERLIRNFLEK
jgi:tRNA dimethylallyltransferase